VNPLHSNALVAEAIERGLAAPLTGYAQVHREVRCSDTRLDFRLVHRQAVAWVEVKTATLVDEGTAYFPDAPTERGRRHLARLTERVAAGERAVLCFVVQRGDVEAVAAAASVDPLYARALAVAADAGVEVLAYRATVSDESLRLSESVDVVV
jgi:sugar fermentation stimulation protein A